MATYKAPLKDLSFALHEIVGIERLNRLERFEEATPDVIDGVLEEMARLVEGSIAPLNEVADSQGCRLEESGVATPEGFQEAYRLFVEGGWPALCHNPEYGGQGLPYALSQVMMEMLSSACMGFSLFPLLTNSACDALEVHGDETLKERYLAKLISGEWTGAMCLTEPQAGSDLAAVRTKAERAEDGSYRLNGTKIFTTSGDHDLTDNNVHFVLARLPDAPAGIKGISMFLVPKHIVGADGEPGERNAMHAASIEEKMGIHGSPTCVMNYDGAVGYLVGEEHQGIQNMFTMMNMARISVGTQGLGAAELATQNAVAYARERKQGRRPGEIQSVAIIEHPDVRRMLLTMKALTEGGRGMLLETAVNVDLARHAEEESERERAQDLVNLFTPICKAFLTDTGMKLADLGVQVYGGHGYIREHGMEQILRDAKIACLYEGTNGIQAMDLIGRKLNMESGRLIERLIDDVQGFTEEEGDNDDLAFIVRPLERSVRRLRELTEWIRSASADDPAIRGAGATPYLQVCALVALGLYWGRAARAAAGRDDDPFFRGKRCTAQFFAEQLLPQVEALAPAIFAGSETMMAPDADCF